MQGLIRCFRIPHGPAFPYVRCYTTPITDSQELRTKITSDIKNALKAKDTLTATTLRAVLAEVQAADKVHKEGGISASAVRAFIAKGIVRRQDAAKQYEKAKRPELAAKERREAEILLNLLPPAMSALQVDQILKQIISSLSTSNKRPSLGQIFKSFYGQVEKSLVPPDILKQRTQALLATVSPSAPSKDDT